MIGWSLLIYLTFDSCLSGASGAVPLRVRCGEAANLDGSFSFKVHLRHDLESIETLQARALSSADPSSPLYGQHLSRDEVHAHLQPSSDGRDAVIEWLQGAGIRHRDASVAAEFFLARPFVSHVEPLAVPFFAFPPDGQPQDCITVTVNVSHAQSWLRVRISNVLYEPSARAGSARSRAATVLLRRGVHALVASELPSLPMSVGRHVAYLEGFGDVPYNTVKAFLATEPSPSSSAPRSGSDQTASSRARVADIKTFPTVYGYGICNYTAARARNPLRLRTDYGIPAKYRASLWGNRRGNLQAIVLPQELFQQTGLALYQYCLEYLGGPPAGTTIDFVNVNGSAIAGPAIPIPPDGEGELDALMVTNTGAGVATSFIWDALQTFPYEMWRQALSMKPLPKVLSNSMGQAEQWLCAYQADPELCAQSQRRRDAFVLQRGETYMAALAAAGVSVFVSSGDAGSITRYPTGRNVLDPHKSALTGWFARDLVNPAFNVPSKFPTILVSSSSAGCVLPTHLFFEIESDGTLVTNYHEYTCQPLITRMMDATGITGNWTKIYTLWHTIIASNFQKLPGTCMVFNSYDIDPPKNLHFGQSTDWWFTIMNPNATSNCTFNTEWSGSISVPNGNLSHVWDEFSIESLDPSPSQYTYLDVQLAEYPSTSPYAAAIGATVLSTSASASPRQEQQALASLASGTSTFTSGSGFSHYFAAGSWQESAIASWSSRVMQNLPTNYPPEWAFNTSKRSTPDLAYCGHDIFMINSLDGATMKATSTGGTSASTPLLAGMFSLINEARLLRRQPTLGLITPALYSFAFSAYSPFLDVTVGSTASDEHHAYRYGFEATEGFDVASGLGTPWFPMLMRLFLAETCNNLCVNGMIPTPPLRKNWNSHSTIQNVSYHMTCCPCISDHPLASLTGGSRHVHPDDDHCTAQTNSSNGHLRVTVRGCEGHLCCYMAFEDLSCAGLFLDDCFCEGVGRVPCPSRRWRNDTDVLICRKGGGAGFGDCHPNCQAGNLSSTFNGQEIFSQVSCSSGCTSSRDLSSRQTSGIPTFTAAGCESFTGSELLACCKEQRTELYCSYGVKFLNCSCGTITLSTLECMDTNPCGSGSKKGLLGLLGLLGLIPLLLLLVAVLWLLHRRKNKGNIYDSDSESDESEDTQDIQPMPIPMSPFFISPYCVDMPFQPTQASQRFEPTPNSVLAPSQQVIDENQPNPIPEVSSVPFV